MFSSKKYQSKDTVEVIESSVGGGLGLRAIVDRDIDDAVWQVIVKYSDTSAVSVRDSMLEVTVGDGDLRQILQPRLLTYEQIARQLDELDGHDGKCIIGSTRSVKVGDVTGRAGGFGSLSQSSRFPNTILQNYLTDEGHFGLDACNRLVSRMDTDIHDEIFVNYFYPTDSCMTYLEAYPLSDREINLFCQWLESDSFDFDKDLAHFKHKYDDNLEKLFIEIKKTKDNNHRNTLLSHFLDMSLIHFRVRHLVEDTLLRLYLEHHYADNINVLRKLFQLDNNSHFGSYKDHDAEAVAMIRSLPNYTELLEGRAWDELRGLVVEMGFLENKNLSEIIVDFNDCNEMVKPYKNDQYYNKFKVVLDRIAGRAGLDVGALEEIIEVKNSCRDLLGQSVPLTGSYAEHDMLMIFDNIRRNIGFIDKTLIRDDGNFKKIMSYVNELRQDIKISLMGRYESLVYGPGLIDLMLTCLQKLKEEVNKLYSADEGLLSRRVSPFNLMMSEYRSLKEIMAKRNHDAHPMMKSLISLLGIILQDDFSYTRMIKLTTITYVSKIVSSSKLKVESEKHAAEAQAPTQSYEKTDDVCVEMPDSSIFNVSPMGSQQSHLQEAEPKRSSHNDSCESSISSSLN